MLKKYLLGFFVGFVGFIGFSSAGFFPDNNSVTDYISAHSSVNVNGNICIKIGTATCFESARFTENGNTQNGWNLTNGMYCFVNSGIYTNTKSSQCTYVIYDMSGFNSSSSCPECESQYTSSECQQEYSLMPISSCDSEFCNMNNLCGTSSGDVTGDGNWSALYINDIQFPGKAFIDVTIPDYITWDYSSDETGFNLYVGSGYDVDYINSIVDINSYRPDSEDFTSIFVSGLTLVFPYLIFALFLAFMRKLIKRIFKH